jgi:peptidoglycan/xylan/chitin deacetylase (PgdA/CDA1 family)
MFSSHSTTRRRRSLFTVINFLYANETLIEQQITGADEDFKKAIGYAPNLYMPSFGAMDIRAHQILDAHGKQTILWSAGPMDGGLLVIMNRLRRL